MMSHFYCGLNPRYQSYTWLPEGTNVMYSAGSFWNDNLFRTRYKFRKNAGRRFLDSGGFTLMNRFGDYPFSYDEYLNLVAYLKPDYFASMDYPCEPEIARNNYFTNNERIVATVELAKILTDHAELLGKVSKQINVIQGYTLDEYKRCIDLYSDKLLIQDYMAIGSMCRRINTNELRTLIPGISEYAKDAGVTKLHWFGLKLDKRLQEYQEFIYSRDSAALLFNYSGNRLPGNRRFPQGQVEKKNAFYTFLERLDTYGINWHINEKKLQDITQKRDGEPDGVTGKRDANAITDRSVSGIDTPET